MKRVGGLEKKLEKGAARTALASGRSDLLTCQSARYTPGTSRTHARSSGGGSDESRIGILLDLSWLFFTKFDRGKWVSSFLELLSPNLQ